MEKRGEFIDLAEKILILFAILAAFFVIWKVACGLGIWPWGCLK